MIDKALDSPQCKEQRIFFTMLASIYQAHNSLIKESLVSGIQEALTFCMEGFKARLLEFENREA